MLVFIRKIGEGFTIGPGIRVVVLGAKGNQVRMGIEAPLEMKILRDELFLKDKQAGKIPAVTGV